MAWPNDNVPGNCWCGHNLPTHVTLGEAGVLTCSECQCAGGFVEDKWVTNANVPAIQ
jgi:hypothetical protein